MQAIRNFVDAITYPFRILARIPSSVVSSPRKLLGLSLPARSALLLFLGLMAILIIWVILTWLLSGRERLWEYFQRTLPALIVLTVAIPLVFWYALKLWLEGERSPFPEIDRVWDSALSKMKEHGIDPTETPIFLLVGPPSEEVAADFLAASRVQVQVHEPMSPAPLHVYANLEAIYLVCTGSSCTGTLLGKLPGDHAAVPSTAPFVANRTMLVGGDEGMGTPLGQAPERSADTPFGIDQPPRGPAPAPAPASLGKGAIQGTMMLDQSMPPAGPVAAPVASPTPPSAFRLDPAETKLATGKLAYVCRCLRQLRDPLCPINGVLVATPFKLLADESQEAVNQLQQSLKADVLTIRSATRVRCSVTHVIQGMDEEPGFRELIRRVGLERAATQRFGKGFGLWNLPTTDQLDALVKHACGAFEDWTYLLFREQEGLSKRGNRHLYGLLCRIRTRFRDRLSHLIQSVYSLEGDSSSVANREPLLFSGCYFVASGHSPDRHAFLASVLQKTQSEEEELEWGSEAIREERRMQLGVQVLLVLNGILFAAIIALLFYQFQLRK